MAWCNEKSFIRLLNMSERPLSLGVPNPRPGREALDKIMRDLM